MKKKTQSPPPPHVATRVEKRKEIRARKQFPAEPRIELFRLWRAGAENGPRLREEQGKVIVEGSARLKGIDPPSIQAEGITAAKIRKLDITSEVEGYYPEHLPLKFKPQLIKKARRTAIRRDRDIPNWCSRRTRAISSETRRSPGARLGKSSPKTARAPELWSGGALC